VITALMLACVAFGEVKSIPALPPAAHLAAHAKGEGEAKHSYEVTMSFADSKGKSKVQKVIIEAKDSIGAKNIAIKTYHPSAVLGVRRAD
jgi:hypothetical protein